MDSSFLVIEMSVDEINYFTTNIPTRPIKIGCLWKKTHLDFSWVIKVAIDFQVNEMWMQ